MKPSIRADRKLPAAQIRDSDEIRLSITNQRGERYCCRANAVSLRIGRGLVQLVERKRGCFVWFEGCRVEVRDGCRNVLFRLLAGAASSDGTDLTIVAEVARRTVGVAAGALVRPNAIRRSTPRLGGTLKTVRNAPQADAA